MSNHNKEYDNLNDMLVAVQLMGKFQRVHNNIRPDFILLLQITEEHKYDDKKDRFIEKFKETYKQICQTWNKEDLQKKYFDSKLQGLIELKRKRDELVHPKELIHLSKATENDFNILKGVFEDYDKFINDLMNDFFVSTKMDSSFLI